MKRIGPAFSGELAVAGLVGLPFSWGDDGSIQFDSRMTPAQIAAVQAVYAAHDPTMRPPPTPKDVAIQALRSLNPDSITDLLSAKALIKDLVKALKDII